MRVFRRIVEATTNLLAIDVSDLAHRNGIGAEPVGDDAFRGRPYFFMMRFRNFSAAALFRFAVTVICGVLSNPPVQKRPGLIDYTDVPPPGTKSQSARCSASIVRAGR